MSTITAEQLKEQCTEDAYRTFVDDEKTPPEVKEYILKAISNGATLREDRGVRSIKDGVTFYDIKLYIEKDTPAAPNGKVKIYQCVRNTVKDTKNWTWINEINRNSECDGIDIWEIDKLLEAASVCDVCKKKIPFKDLIQHHYAGACCKDCYPEQERDWKENLHYYTD